jgi:hypothetical protein
MTKSSFFEVLRNFSEKKLRPLQAQKYLIVEKKYFTEKRFISLYLSEYDKEKLMIAVRGITATYQGTIYLADEDGYKLQCICNCPAWSKKVLCKHNICSLLTIDDFLHNNKIDLSPSNKTKEASDTVLIKQAEIKKKDSLSYAYKSMQIVKKLYVR